MHLFSPPVYCLRNIHDTASYQHATALGNCQGPATLAGPSTDAEPARQLVSVPSCHLDFSQCLCMAIVGNSKSDTASQFHLHAVIPLASCLLLPLLVPGRSARIYSDEWWVQGPHKMGTDPLHEAFPCPIFYYLNFPTSQVSVFVLLIIKLKLYVLDLLTSRHTL